MHTNEGEQQIADQLIKEGGLERYFDHIQRLASELLKTLEENKKILASEPDPKRDPEVVRKVYGRAAAEVTNAELRLTSILHAIFKALELTKNGNHGTWTNAPWNVEYSEWAEKSGREIMPEGSPERGLFNLGKDIALKLYVDRESSSEE